MKKKRKSVDLDKVREDVQKAGKVTAIVLRVVWVLLGVAAFAAFIFVAVKIGQALKVDLPKVPIIGWLFK